MKVGNVTPKHFVNYSMAAAAVFPLGLAVPTAVAVTALRPSDIPARSSVSSESGQWLEREWAGIQSSLKEVALRKPFDATIDYKWYETPGDAVYPPPRETEVLNVELVDDTNSDEFTFAHTDFDVWR